MRKLSLGTTDIEEYYLSRLTSQIESGAWYEHCLGGSVSPVALGYNTSDFLWCNPNFAGSWIAKEIKTNV